MGAANAFAALLELARREQWRGYLVGGCVRDRLLQRPARDLDLVGPGASVFARQAARLLRAAFVPLDLERGTTRLVLPDGAYLDFNEPAGTLDDDLAARDFTINAMACDLESWATDAPRLRDPRGGRADLAARLIRAVREDSLLADPLRCLRAYRLAAALEFKLESGTAELIRAAAPFLSQVASERVLAEWIPLLSVPASAAAVAALARDGVLAALLPVPADPAAVAAVDRAAATAHRATKDWLAQGEHRAFARFAALLGPASGNDAALVARFALSRAQRRLLRQLRAPLPAGLATPRELAELALNHGAAALGVLLLAAARGELTPERQAAAERRLAEEVLPRWREAPLVTGHQLQETLGIPPGPAYQRLLREARLAQLSGEVTDASAALAVAREVAERDR